MLLADFPCGVQVETARRAALAQLGDDEIARTEAEKIAATRPERPLPAAAAPPRPAGAYNQFGMPVINYDHMLEFAQRQPPPVAPIPAAHPPLHGNPALLAALARLDAEFANEAFDGRRF